MVRTAPARAFPIIEGVGGMGDSQMSLF